MQINGNVIIIRGSARCSDSLAANGNGNGKYAYISKQRQAMSSVVDLVVVVVVAVLPFIICLIYSFALRAAPRRLESPLGSGQALEVAARFAWDALPAVLAEHLSRLLATHRANGDATRLLYQMQTDAASLFSARAHVQRPCCRCRCLCCCCCRKRRRQSRLR